MSRWTAVPVVAVLLVSLALLSGCARPDIPADGGSSLAYIAADSASGPRPGSEPVFLINQPEFSFNRIGSPQVVTTGGGRTEVAVDPGRPVIYSETFDFATAAATYTNVVYRVHFAETPVEFFPFQLSAGKNVGLLVIITCNRQGQPLLITTLHTCGCYLAFVPTSFLGRAAYPKWWRQDQRQRVYGKSLPARLDFDGRDYRSMQVLVELAGSSHRVRDIRLIDAASLAALPLRQVPLQPLAALEAIAAGDGSTESFFETSGARVGYVKHSRKIWERLLIGWWALDWRVGEDKRYRPESNAGPVFYTSLKPWARYESDLRNFSRFLEYWGWRL